MLILGLFRELVNMFIFLGSLVSIEVFLVRHKHLLCPFDNNNDLPLFVLTYE